MDAMDVIGNIINITLVYATALIFTSMGGIVSEKSGVINIGLEGLMTIGAFTAAITAFYMQTKLGMGASSLWIGMIAAMIASAAFSCIHAVASVSFKANQIVSGVVVNFLAAGLAVYLVKLLFDGSGTTDTLKVVFGKIEIPFLSSLPIIGNGIFVAYPTTFLALILVVAIYYVLFKTPFGLRLRAVGDHPSAADTVGVKVSRMRYMAVMLSGALAGLGGATIVLTTTSNFSHNTISGQGYIALAAMIFGKWNPFGALVATLFFGFSQALGNIVQLYPWANDIPREFIYMLPYILTILILVGAIGRAYPPAALGEPYDPNKR